MAAVPVIFEAIFETDAVFEADFGSVIEINKNIDPYEGAYSVTPLTVAQVLPTEGKTMKQDLTVEEIPYAETSNEYGTTVTIAS